MKEKNSKIQYEIKDMMMSLQRFLATNKNRAVFVGGILAFDEDGKVKENSGALFAFGQKLDLRNLLFDLRNTIEDEADDKDFVNI